MFNTCTGILEDMLKQLIEKAAEDSKEEAISLKEVPLSE